MDFPLLDAPLPFEEPEEEEERKRREQLAIAEAIAAEEGITGARSNIRDAAPVEPTSGVEESPVEDSIVDQYLQMVKGKQKFLEPVTNLVTGAVGGLASAPWRMGAGITAIPGAITDTIGDVNRISARGTTRPASDVPRTSGTNLPSSLLDTAKMTEDNIARALGVPTAPEGAAYLLRKVGQSATIGARAPASIVATAGITGANILADYLKHDAGANITADEAMRRHPGDELARKPISVPEWLQSALIGTAEAAGPKQFVTPRVNHTTIQTQGGPAEVPVAELNILGGITLASLGMIFAPKLYHTFKFESLPKFRPVVNAAPGTMDITNVGDLLRTYDNADAGLLRVARRVGVEPAVLQELEHGYGIQGRMGAQAVADAAIMGGHAETPSITFRTRTPISEINRIDTPELSRYAHLYDTADQINIIESSNKYLRQQAAAGRGVAPPPGPATVFGLTMQDITREIGNMERANPQLRAIHGEYKNFVRDVRNFESSGEYGTISVAERNARNNGTYGRKPGETEFAGPNEVPFVGARTKGNPIDRGSFSQVAGDVYRVRLKDRMHNELVGMYVDAINRRQRFNGPNQQLFRRVTEEELRLNPTWKENTVSFRRRGEWEHYTTSPFLADVLKLDPYFFTSMAGNVMFSMKRAVEIGTTGYLAPLFAPTSMLRNWMITKFTTPNTLLNRGLSWFNHPDMRQPGGVGPGPAYRSPGILGAVTAIPAQLLPQMAKAFSGALDRGSAGWLTRVLGQGNVDALSTRLAHSYERSIYAQMQSAGSHKGSLLEQHTQAFTSLTNHINQMTDPRVKAIFNGYKALLNSMHNAPSFAFVRKNYGKAPVPELALTARRLTGDPRTAGQYYGHSGKPIRFENQSSRVIHTLGQVARGWGIATEIGRSSVPWFNATTQGIKRIGQAYLENPAAFVGKAWLYSMMPAAATYLMNRAWDKDPNGRSYVDYQMNGRSDYRKTMNLYIGIPGLPVEQGIEIPIFHELAIAARLMTAGMDHAFRSSIFTEKEDFMRALWSVMDIAVAPPYPPIFGLALATQGMTSSGGVFGGEAYHRKNSPYDSTSGLPVNIELYLRALVPGIGEMVGAGAAAFTQTPKGVIQGFNNAFKEIGTRMSSRTPIVRDVFGTYAPAAGNTNITEELFKKQKVIDHLTSFHKTWGLTGEKDINTKPASKAGGLLAQEALKKQGDVLGGESLSPTRPGLAQAPPTNPLYLEGAAMIWNKFKKDAPVTDPKMLPGRDDKYDPRISPDDPKYKPLAQTPGAKLTREKKKAQAEERYKAALDEGGGGMGYKSLWNRYGDATAKIRDLQKINAGNFVTWQERLAKRDPEGLQELKRNNIPMNDHIAVRNFYERIRQTTGRTILFAIRDVEDQLSKKYGMPIKLENLDPYGKPPSGFAGDAALDLSVPAFR